MAFYSTQRVTSDGTLELLPVSIEYFDRSEITVFFDDVLADEGTDWDWVGSTDHTIAFLATVPDGVEVMVVRTTDISTVRHVFVDGAAFLDETMDENYRQMLHIAQEARERASIADMFSDLNMHGYKIINVGPATDPNDAISLAQYQADAEGAWVARNQAVAAKDAAVAAKVQAETAEANAELAEANAEVAETNAETAAALAQDWAIKTTGPVAGSEYSAKYHAQLAASSATAATDAKVAAELAETNAETAETNAETAQAAAEDARDLAEGYAASINPENFATAAQGAKADTAVQPAAIANMLETGDIGSSVQAYDADTAKLDVAQNWSAVQRSAGSTDNDLNFDLNAANNFVCTPTGTGMLTFTNLGDGKSGYVLLTNSGGYAISKAAHVKAGASFLSTISAAGTYLISYYSNGSSVYVTGSGALT